MADEPKFVIKHDRPNCIGCAACASVSPEFWTMNEDGKSDVIGGAKLENGWEQLDIKEKDYEANKQAAEVCPVNVIHLHKKDTDEKII